MRVSCYSTTNLHGVRELSTGRGEPSSNKGTEAFGSKGSRMQLSSNRIPWHNRDSASEGGAVAFSPAPARTEQSTHQDPSLFFSVLGPQAPTRSPNYRYGLLLGGRGHPRPALPSCPYYLRQPRRHLHGPRFPSPRGSTRLLPAARSRGRGRREASPAGSTAAGGPRPTACAARIPGTPRPETPPQTPHSPQLRAHRRPLRPGPGRARGRLN